MSSRAWTLILLLLLATRLPALVEPPGHDQSLYTYRGERLLAGTVPYLDAWDQKPPAIAVVYATLLLVTPARTVPALGDLVAAGLVAWLLVVVGRRRFDAHTGPIAAAIFLLFSHPAIARLSGAYVRGQCEVFIAAAITAMIALVADRRARPWASVAAGLLLGLAFWLKYNALAYALPAAIAIVSWSDREHPTVRGYARDLIELAGGFLIVTAMTMGYFLAHGAVDALWRATIEYNLQYSGQTYRGLANTLLYPLLVPIRHAAVDFLWFLGGVGTLTCLLRWREPWVRVLIAWLVAAVVSIAVNGARDLPQYFIQAAPALALAAGAGITTIARRPVAARWAFAGLVFVGFWRVGADPGWQLKAAGLPQLVGNLTADLSYFVGRTPRHEYLSRFKGEQKYDAAEIDALAGYLRESTTPADPVLIFGFSPGVYVESGRVSPTRFFWSRPVVIEFAATRPGYGSAGLLADLQAHPPAVIALQKKDWAILATTAGGADASREPNSADFFLGHPALRAWLDARYVLDRDTPVFSVWRRRS